MMKEGLLCINCHQPATQLHHVVPKSLGGNDTTNVVPLCDKCHGLIHHIEYEEGKLSHSELTKIGMRKAKENGKQIGRIKGQKYPSKKEQENKIKIKELSIDFNGEVKDKELINMLGICRNTFYKYKYDLRQEEEDNAE